MPRTARSNAASHTIRARVPALMLPNPSHQDGIGSNGVNPLAVTPPGADPPEVNPPGAAPEAPVRPPSGGTIGPDPKHTIAGGDSSVSGGSAGAEFSADPGSAGGSAGVRGAGRSGAAVKANRARDSRGCRASPASAAVWFCETGC